MGFWRLLNLAMLFTGTSLSITSAAFQGASLGDGPKAFNIRLAALVLGGVGAGCLAVWRNVNGKDDAK